MFIFVQRRCIPCYNTGLYQFLCCCQVQVSGIYPLVIECIRQFYFVDLQISTHNGKHHSTFGYIADGFHGLCLRNIQESRKITDGHTAWCMDLFECFFRLSFKLGAHKFGLLTIGSIITTITDHGVIFTSLGDADELLRCFAAYGPAVSMNDNKTQTTTCEDGSISVSHLTVTDIHPFSVSIETVEILHYEFTYAQQASTGTRLITQFGLYLVDELREITITAHKL